MEEKTDTASIKDLVDKAQSILVVVHERPNFDGMGSALALYLGLTSLGKKVTVACPDAMTVELSNFVGANKVTSDIAKKNFIISLDYVEGSIEKVSYNIEGNTFNLVVEQREGFELFSQDKVKYKYAGGSADLIFTVNTIHLGGLKKLYEADKDLYASKPVINIDRHPNNVHYGQINIVEPSAAATAELVYKVMQDLGIELTEDIATNLLNALYSGTNNFVTTSVSAKAFEMAAACMQAGGKRFRRQTNTEETTSSETVATPPVSPVQTTPVEVVKQTQKATEAPADWLKPKIFKSSNLL